MTPLTIFLLIYLLGSFVFILLTTYSYWDVGFTQSEVVVLATLSLFSWIAAVYALYHVCQEHLNKNGHKIAFNLGRKDEKK